MSYSPTQWQTGDLVTAEKLNNIEGGIVGNEAEIDDLRSDISQVSGLSADIKSALLQIAAKVAYIDEDGQDYYDALEAALYPPANLVSISAVYTQSGTVYDTDSLDDLKSDLVVTATYDDSTTETVTTYTLSGTLTAGTSTITVAYGGKTTTFTVTVTHYQSYVTNGLIHRWDAIDNTANGHDGTSTTWKDLVGTYDLTMNNSAYATWESNALVLAGTVGEYLAGSDDASSVGTGTVEVCFAADGSQTAALLNPYKSSVVGKMIIYSDNTFNVTGASGLTYDHGGSTIGDLNHIAGTIQSSAIDNAYANGAVASHSSKSHSMSHTSAKLIVGQTNSGSSGSLYPFKGRIYSIRIYDRVLTAAEIAQNYAIDVDRFELGG